VASLQPPDPRVPGEHLPRVLHVIQNAGFGGSESMFLNLTRALHTAGWPLVLAVGQQGWLVEQARGLGIPVHVVPGLHRERAFDVRSVLMLRRLILAYDCALVHAMMFPGQLYASIAARLARRPCIVNVRNSHYDLVGGRRRFIWRRVIAPLSPMVVTVTEQLAQEARQVTGSDRVTCVHNGVEVERFVLAGDRNVVRARLGVPEDAVVIGTVGILRPVKGHADLILAAAVVARRSPSLRVLLIGAEPGPTAGELRRLCREQGLAERVLFLGHRDDVPELLQSMDIFCLPSHSEGMSGALLQAMAAGLPAVATAVGGNPEVVVAGETGYLVPVRDPERLAEALLALVEQPGLRKTMGQASLARVKAEFRLSTMIARYAQLYSSLIVAPSGTVRMVGSTR